MATACLRCAAKQRRASRALMVVGRETYADKAHLDARSTCALDGQLGILKRAAFLEQGGHRAFGGRALFVDQLILHVENEVDR